MNAQYLQSRPMYKSVMSWFQGFTGGGKGIGLIAIAILAYLIITKRIK